jgi:hypothetical protein
LIGLLYHYYKSHGKFIVPDSILPISSFTFVTNTPPYSIGAIVETFQNKASNTATELVPNCKSSYFRLFYPIAQAIM